MKMDSERLEQKVNCIKKSIQTRVDQINKRVSKKLGSINQRFPTDIEKKTDNDNPGEMAQKFEEVLPKYSSAKIDIYDALKVEVVDETFDQIFNITQYFTGEDLNYPTYYCESLEEFFKPHVKHLALSDEIKQELIASMVSEAKQMAAFSHGGVFGVNWPGDGCYLNGWLLSYPNTEDPAAALKDQNKIPYILGTLAHEKLGHGFLSEFTTLGKEMQKIQIARFKIADDFNIKISDSPKEILLKEKWQYLFTHCMYAEEGYATWIEHFLLEELLGASRGSYEKKEILNTLELVDSGLDVNLKSKTGLSLKDAFTTWLNPPSNIVQIHQVVRHLEELEWQISTSRQWQQPQPARYVLGFLLLDNISQEFGRELLPYIMAIAYNITYDLDTISNSDLNRILDNEPTMNIHTRLLTILAMGSEEIDSVESLVQKCKTFLNMALPANFNI